MPTIKCISGPRMPLVGSGTGFALAVFQYPPKSYPALYTPRTTSELETIAYWLAESPVVAAPALISKSGISVGPAPTGAPERFEFDFTYSDIDINDLDYAAHLGILVGGGAAYRDSSHVWDIGISAPPVACIAEVIIDGDTLLFHAVAQSYTAPKTSWFYSGVKTPVPITLWQFDFGDDIVLTTSENITVEAAGDSYVYRSAPVVLSEIPEGPFGVRVRVQDAEGAVSNWGYVTVQAPERTLLFGSILDVTGTLFTAVNDGDNVQVYRFPAGVDSRESRSQILNAKNPSYTVDARNTHFVSYENRTTGVQEMVQSTDGGRTWQ